MPDRGKSVDYDYSQQANKDYILDIYPDINYRETANVPSYRERHSTKLTDQTENYLSYYATLGTRIQRNTPFHSVLDRMLPINSDKTQIIVSIPCYLPESDGMLARKISCADSAGYLILP